MDVSHIAGGVLLRMIVIRQGQVKAATSACMNLASEIRELDEKLSIAIATKAMREQDRPHAERHLEDQRAMLKELVDEQLRRAGTGEESL